MRSTTTPTEPGPIDGAAFDRVAHVVAGVVAAALRDACRSRLVLIDDGGPEAELVARFLAEAARRHPLERVRDAMRLDRDQGDWRRAEELRAAAHAATRDDGLLLNPANKTVAVLWPETLAEPVLPLADLYASQVASLSGGWSAPAAALELIERAGGIHAVDAFLVEHLDRRHPVRAAADRIADPGARAELIDRLAAGWWWRRRLGVVPKLGARTLGIDLR